MADGKVTIDSELNDKGLDQGLKNLQGKLQSTGKKLQSVGGNLTKNLTLPIVAAGTGALLMAAKFDDSMRTVKATMGKNLGSSTKEADANFKALREEALKLGATTAHSASDASGAMKELAQMGYDTNQILASTGTVLDVASASGLDLDFVATTLAGSMNQFGVEVDDNGVNIKRFGDVMVRAGQMSGTSMEEIAHALEYVGSSAYNSGMDIEQTSAYIGILGDQSIKGGKAGTALNAMLRDMKGKVKDGNLEFDDFNVAMYDSQGNMRDMTDIMEDLEKGLDGKSDAERDAALSAVFGSQAQTAVNAILGEGTDQVRKYENELKLANDTAKIAAGEMEGGIGGALRGLASATEALSIAFGDVLAPVIQKIAQFVANLFLKFTELTDGQKKTVVAVLGVLAAIGPLLTMIGTLIIVISKVVGAFAMLTPPILIAIGVITALIAIGVALATNWDTVKAKAIEVFSHFAPLLDTVKGAFQTLGESVTPIMENLKTLWQSLLPILEMLGAIIGGVLVAAFGVAISIFSATVAAIGPLINAVISLADFVVNMVNLIIAVLTGDFAGAMEYWNAMTESAINFFVSLWEGVVNFFSTFIETIVDFFYGLYMTLVGNSIIPDMVEAIVEWFTNMWEWLVEIVSSIVDSVVSFFTGLWSKTVSIFESIGEAISNIWNGIKSFFTTVVTAIVNLVKQRFENLKNNVSAVFNAVKNLISTIWNGIRSFFTTVITAIVNLVKQRFENLKNNVTTVFNAVRSVTSSVWNAIRNVISTVVNAIRSVVTSVFNAIRSTISSVMNAIRSVISSVWNGIRSVISSVVNAIQSVISSGFNAARNVVSSVSNAIRSTVSSIFNGLRGIVTGAMSGVRNAVTNGMQGALRAVTSVGSAFRNAGSKIVSMIADGIKAAASKVTDAASNLMGKVRNMLPFSPAKDGPLTDIHRLNFGGPIGDSIDDAIPDVQAKMNTMLEMPTFEAPKTSEAFNLSQLVGKLQEKGETIQIRNVLKIDGEDLADILVDPIDTRMGNKFDIDSYTQGVR